MNLEEQLRNEAVYDDRAGTLVLRVDEILPIVAQWLHSKAEERRGWQPGHQHDGEPIRRIEANVLELYSRRLDPEGYARAVGLSYVEPAVTPPSEGTQE